MEASSYSDDNNDETENQGMDYRRHTDHSNISQSRDYHAETNHGERHRYLSNLARGRTINFCINGNAFFPSKKLIYNPKQFRDLSNYMDYLTERLQPRFGAVRKIYTPKHGSRVLDLADLQEDNAYVVAGNEHFKPYKYDQITSSERKRSPPFNYSADPVYHNRQFLSSGKIKKWDTHSLLIKVWPNGGDLKGPRRVLVTPRIKPYTLSTVISHVNEMLKEDCLGTVDTLYFLTGTQVSDVEQIVQNGQYVACRRAEKFKRARYNEQAVKNIATSPRLDRKLLAPLFPRSVNSTSLSSPEHSNSSTQNSLAGYSHRRKAGDRDEDRMFPSKPIKYTRGSDTGHTNGFDKDHGGAFRANDTNRHTRAHTEAAHNRHSKPDQSADHWDAEDVDDEPMSAKGTKKSGTKTQESSRGHITRRDMSTTTPQKPERPGRRPSTDETLGEDSTFQAGYGGYEPGKQQSSLPRGTDPSHGMGARNNHMEQYQDARQRKSTANNAKQQMIEKLPASNLQTRNRDFNSNKPRQSSPDVTEEEAATKIQAGLRGYQTRKRMSQEKAAATTIQSCFRGYRERKRLGTSSTKTSSDSSNHPNSKHGAIGQVKAKANTQQASAGQDGYGELTRENDAARTIQSHYRGYLTRKTQAPKHASRRK